MPFDYYRIFYYVAKYKSFSRAAKALNNNQPNITRCMNIMENELGCKLFIRSHRGIQLTPEGEQLMEHVAIAIKHITSGNEELNEKKNLKSGTVSIGVSETALHLWLLPKLEKFHKTYPHIKLKISNHSTYQAMEALQKGLVNFAVITGPVSCNKPLQKQVLCSFHEILIGGPSFQEIASSPKRLRDLQDFPFISLMNHTATRNFYEKYFYDNHLIFSPDMEAATTNQVLSLVQHDLGLGFCPEEMAKDSILRNEIIKIPVEEPMDQREICLITDTSKPVSVADQKMIEIIMNKEV